MLLAKAAKSASISLDDVGFEGSGSASDNFMRANGGLGANWTTVPGGAGWVAPAIVSDAVNGEDDRNQDRDGDHAGERV